MVSFHKGWLLASALGFVWFAAVTADVVFHGALTGLDDPVGRWAAATSAGSPIAVAAIVLSDVGSFVVVALLLVAVAAFLVWRGRRLDAIRVALVALATEAFVTLAKLIVARPRPVERLVAADGGSFPSGHAATAAMLATLLVWYALSSRRPRWIVVAALAGAVAWTLAMAWARLALHVHYFTDVLGSFGAGVGVAGLVLSVREP